MSAAIALRIPRYSASPSIVISPPTGEPVGSNLAPRSVKGGAMSSSRQTTSPFPCWSTPSSGSAVALVEEIVSAVPTVPSALTVLSSVPVPRQATTVAPLGRSAIWVAPPLPILSETGPTSLPGEIRRSRISGFPPASFRQETVATPARSTATSGSTGFSFPGPASPASTAGRACRRARPSGPSRSIRWIRKHRQATNARPEGAIATRGPYPRPPGERSICGPSAPDGDTHLASTRSPSSGIRLQAARVLPAESVAIPLASAKRALASTSLSGANPACAVAHCARQARRTSVGSRKRMSGA